MMDFETEATDLIKAMSRAIEESAPEMASAYRAQYEAFVEAGFTEEQAMELTKDIEMGLDE